MPEFHAKLICWTAIWLSMFAIAMVIAVFPLHAFSEATCKIRQSSLSAATPAPESENTDSKPCEQKVPVEVTPKRRKHPYLANATVTCKEVDQLTDKQYVTCWYSHNNEENVRIVFKDQVADYRYAAAFSVSLGKAALVMAVVFGFCFVVSIGCIFKTELVRCCPRFVLALLMNIHSFLSRRRRSRSPPPTPNGSLVNSSVSHPPMATSRRRISALVESAKLSEDEVHALEADGWSCCICLEKQPENGYVPAVSRLQCNHATHSDCLRSWLEKGRAVCCLCNADVFPEGMKEATVSTGGSSVSGYDIGATGSLDVERTEGAPSSLATSVFVDLPHTNPIGRRLSEDREGEV